MVAVTTKAYKRGRNIGSAAMKACERGRKKKRGALHPAANSIMHGPKRPNHAGQNHDRINKKKKKVQLPRGYWLQVLLNRAEDFDLPNPPPERWTRLHGGYQVNVWLSSEKVYRSKIKKKNEDGDAVWGEEFEMLVDAQATGELMIHRHKIIRKLFGFRAGIM